MASLIERLRAAREQWAKVGEFELLFRRPTRLQLALWGEIKPSELLRQAIIGWRGVTELTLSIPGGEGRNVPFDLDLCVEWLEDHPVELQAAVEAVTKLITEQIAAQESLEKN